MANKQKLTLEQLRAAVKQLREAPQMTEQEITDMMVKGFIATFVAKTR